MVCVLHFGLLVSANTRVDVITNRVVGTIVILLTLLSSNFSHFTPIVSLIVQSVLPSCRPANSSGLMAASSVWVGGFVKDYFRFSNHQAEQRHIERRDFMALMCLCVCVQCVHFAQIRCFRGIRKQTEHWCESKEREHCKIHARTTNSKCKTSIKNDNRNHIENMTTIYEKVEDRQRQEMERNCFGGKRIL